VLGVKQIINKSVINKRENIYVGVFVITLLFLAERCEVVTQEYITEVETDESEEGGDLLITFSSYECPFMYCMVA
jgi:hypothetical protein